MKIILNRDIKKLGKVGDVVSVRDGYGRNFLVPKGYAAVATKSNIVLLEEKINELKKQNDILFDKAKKASALIETEIFNVVRQSADDDTIYGSIRTKDIYVYICDLLKKNNIDFSFDIGAIKIAEPIKSLGQYIVNVDLFSGVEAIVRLNVCRAEADFEQDVSSFDKKRKKKIALNAKDVKENIEQQFTEQNNSSNNEKLNSEESKTDDQTN